MNDKIAACAVGLLAVVAVSGCSEFYSRTPPGQEPGWEGKFEPSSRSRGRLPSPATSAPKQTPPISSGASVESPPARAVRTYAGLSAGLATGTLNLSATGVDLTVSRENPDLVGSVFAGVEFRPHGPASIAIEGDYQFTSMDLGRTTIGSVRGESSIKHAASISVLPGFYLNDGLKVFARAGFGWLKGEGTYTDGTGTYSTDSNRQFYKLGLGASYQFDRRTIFRAEYVLLTTERKDEVRAQVSIFQMGLGFSF
ncbi:MAG: outer membrane beta-barrel protein [Burkholderiales bacterium]